MVDLSRLDKAEQFALARLQLRLAKFALFAGGALSLCGGVVALYGYSEILLTGCSNPMPGVAYSGCPWSVPPGIFLVEGILFVSAGLVTAILARLSWKKQLRRYRTLATSV